MQKRVYGHHKQGARFGHTKIQGKSLLVRGLNALAAVISTPIAAPVIAATRLRGGNAASPAARPASPSRPSAPQGSAAAPARSSSGWTRPTTTPRSSARSAATARGSPHRPGEQQHPRRIAAIGDDAWTAIRYPRAIWDDQLDCWISDAEVAETQYTAFASKKGRLSPPG